MHVAVRGVDPGEDPEVLSISLRASDATAGIAQIEHVELAVGVDLVVSGGSVPVIEKIRAWTRGRHSGEIDVTEDLQPFLGRAARNGLRAATPKILSLCAVPDNVRGLLSAAMHDVPIATILVRSSRRPANVVDDLAEPAPVPVDICAGFRRNGALHRTIQRRGSRRLGYGPTGDSVVEIRAAAAGATTLGRPPGTVSRVRRIDVTNPSIPTVDAMFRDTTVEHAAPTNSGPAIVPETTVHEYRVHAELDADRLRVARCRAEPVVLPAPECPAAAASANRLDGVRLVDIADRVADLCGTSTCTHLTDALWQLNDLPTLLRRLDSV
jgi:hypothetical protein